MLQKISVSEINRTESSPFYIIWYGRNSTKYIPQRLDYTEEIEIVFDVHSRPIEIYDKVKNALEHMNTKPKSVMYRYAQAKIRINRFGATRIGP